MLCVLERPLKWPAPPALNYGKITFASIIASHLISNKSNPNENVICNSPQHLQCDSQWQYFKTWCQNFKNSLQRGNDKSPRRSKIARFFLFYLQMSRRSLELISVSFQIRSWVEAFITLCRAQVWAGRTKSPFSCHGRSILSTQMPPLQVTYRTRERARGCNKRGNLLAARRHTQLRYVWSREKGSKTQHWDEMKQLSGLNR